MFKLDFEEQMGFWDAELGMETRAFRGNEQMKTNLEGEKKIASMFGEQWGAWFVWLEVRI